MNIKLSTKLIIQPKKKESILGGNLCARQVHGMTPSMEFHNIKTPCLSWRYPPNLNEPQHWKCHVVWWRGGTKYELCDIGKSPYLRQYFYWICLFYNSGFFLWDFDHALHVWLSLSIVHHHLLHAAPHLVHLEHLHQPYSVPLGLPHFTTCSEWFHLVNCGSCSWEIFLHCFPRVIFLTYIWVECQYLEQYGKQCK